MLSVARKLVWSVGALGGTRIAHNSSLRPSYYLMLPSLSGMLRLRSCSSAVNALTLFYLISREPSPVVIESAGGEAEIMLPYAKHE